MTIRTRTNRARAGMTLVELLVVVSIMLLLAIVAIPAFQPVIQNRKIREGARAVNVYMGSARNRAIETRQSRGVWIQRDERQPQSAVTIYQANVPPPYAGDTTETQVQVQIADDDGDSIADVDGDGYTILKVRLSNGTASDRIFKIGDIIKINFQEPVYRISNGTDGNSNGFLDGFPIKVQADLRKGQSVPWPLGPTNWSRSTPFQIVCSPTRSAVAPLELPRGVVIDLFESGLPGLAFEPANASDTSPVILTFGPTGAVEYIYNQDKRETVSRPICLLIGRSDRIPATFASPSELPQHDDGLRNWQDLNNLWVAVNPYTGSITTAENALYTPASGFDYENNSNDRLTAFHE
ncbi:MAG: prepilin-type N-terminal cleavage/methylation domain-containing protein, partial [Pirellulaceae bacterium]|nr:prepilin-type N-terminal cleavage/methylation domain-containing protein [Pirellulaceae bacterium]